MTVHKTSLQAEAANPQAAHFPAFALARFDVTAFVRFAGSSWYGLAEPKLAKAGGPGRTRTCNQTVMSGKGIQIDIEKAGQFDED